MPGNAVPTADWHTFFMIVGGSAGALTGLMFVAITLTQQRRASVVARAARSFATPTIVHFATVLSLAALLSMPGLTRASLGAILLMTGAVLLLYMLWVFRNMRAQDHYTPDLEDRIWHFSLPPLAHVAMLIAGASAWSSPNTSLHVVAGSMLALLVVGIHNAWDSAVWNVIRNNSSDEG